MLLDAIAGYDARDASSVNGPTQRFSGALRSDLTDVRIGVVRRFGDEEAAPNDELHAAMDEALRLIEGLGARLVDVHLRPLREYYDVWSLIEAPETFSIQRRALIERPQDFGSVFLQRTLIACLIDGADYVQAQRGRSRIVADMEAVFSGCDVLVSAGAGPAPKLYPGLAAWPNPNRFVPFTITGRPAVAVCIGFSKTGLPLGVQFIGRPFADANVLGIAHACEQAMGFWRHRPAVSPEARAPTTVTRGVGTATAGIDATVVDLCTRAAESAGLRLPDHALALLCTAAPHLREMVERVRGAHDGRFEPASVFAVRHSGH
jgi:aspartyl-tRNA(Asn)/glutamyl-tRNA(Gln) amidotransferase subunit A